MKKWNTPELMQLNISETYRHDGSNPYCAPSGATPGNNASGASGLASGPSGASGLASGASGNRHGRFVNWH